MNCIKPTHIGKGDQLHPFTNLNVDLGNSLVVLWLGLGASTSRAQVQFLVTELRYCNP